MKLTSDANTFPKSNEAFCTASPLDASRFVAWVSTACAVVRGVTVGGFVVCGLNFYGPFLLMLIATVVHIGQAAASAISFKPGALFATIAFVIAAAILIGDYQNFVLLATPLTCSACAIIIARCYASPHSEVVG